MRKTKYLNAALLALFLAGVAGCGSSAPNPLKFNESTLAANKKLFKACQDLGKAMLPLTKEQKEPDPEKMRQAYDRVVKTLKEIKEEAKAWKLPPAQSAKDYRDAYLDYLERTGLAEYRKTPGNKVLTLRRIGSDKAEFLLVSFWDSLEAIRAFAGDEIGRAVFDPEDDRFLVDRDRHVDHFEVVHRAGPDRA